MFITHFLTQLLVRIANSMERQFELMLDDSWIDLLSYVLSKNGLSSDLSFLNILKNALRLKKVCVYSSYVTSANHHDNESYVIFQNLQSSGKSIQFPNCVYVRLHLLSKTVVEVLFLEMR